MFKFFFFTFSGRVLNRFSKDIGQMDELLPYTYYDYCRVGFICDISEMRLLNISTGWKEVPMATLLGATTKGTVILVQSVKQSMKPDIYQNWRESG